jgi:hypothetical protein
MTRRLSLLAGLALLLSLGLCCSGSEDSYPPTAKVEVHEQFLTDLASKRHPADGGGTVELILQDGEDGSIQAGGFGRWEFEYTAGTHGIAEGGSLFLLAPPFWGWSTPQSEAPTAPGYTTVESETAGLEPRPQTVDRNLLQIEITGRALVAGETLRIVYGAGEGLARADDYAEARSTFYFKVDGDGDGISKVVADTPSVAILPGPPARLTANLTSTAEPGGRVALTVAVLDALASAGCELEGTLRLESEPPGLELPAELQLQASDRGRARVEFGAPVEGLFRVRVSLQSDLLQTEARSNPLRVAPGQRRLLWGDLHGHSAYSDGTGTPAQYFEYARDVAGLDLVVLTDHDHFGVRFLDATPEIWDEIRGEVEHFNEPGRFVALLGYEWTSWLYGHRHVVYFNGRGEVLSSVGAQTTTPAELWAALLGSQALTFAHHSAGGPVATDWSFVPDPRVEPVTEIMSVHGSSEAADSPARIYSPVKGNFVRDQLERGLSFGFIGSGDSHDGHPGLAHLSPKNGYRRARPDPRGRRAEERQGNGGLAAIRASELTPEALLEGLRRREVYATSGPRILLDVSLGGHPMGSTIVAAELEQATPLQVQIAGTSGIKYVELLRRGEQAVRYPCDGVLDFRFEEPIAGLVPGDYLYLRLVQDDGALAWSSPFFVE